MSTVLASAIRGGKNSYRCSVEDYHVPCNLSRLGAPGARNRTVYTYSFTRLAAGIFGMNMRSALEPSVAAFWAVTAAIVLGAAWLYMAIMNYTRRRRIL